MNQRILKTHWATTRALICFVMTLLGLNSGVAQAQSSQIALQNFVQLRYFYPAESPNFISGLTLDANLQFAIDPTTNLSFSIKNTTLVRQTAALEITADWGSAGVSVTGEPSATGARFGITGTAVYLFPRGETPSPLEVISASVFHEADSSSGSDFYTIDVASLQLSGNISGSWRWNGAYNFTSNVTSTQNTVRHLGSVGISGRIDAFNIGLGGSLTADNGNTVYGGTLSAAWNITSNERLGFKVGVTSKPSDDQSLTFSTSSFAPVTLGLSIGRSSPGNFTAGANLEYLVSDQVTFNAEYAGAFGLAPTHSVSAGLAYSQRPLRTSINLSWSTEIVSNASNFGVGASASYKADAIQFGLRGSFALASTPTSSKTSGSLTANLTWVAAPFSIILETGLSFRNAISGTAQAQLLFDITQELALNGSVQYRRSLVAGGANSVAFGLGLRYRF
jgi:hypothetical protein